MSDRLRIIFVDDEVQILHGLRRSMREMEDIWDMAFCTSGAEALRLMSHQPFDVVVADMRMPEMDGSQFLGKVREDYPGTLRVVLSGYADNESILRTVEVSHCYLAKPCSSRILKETIDRQFALRRLLANEQLRATLASLENLPSPPPVVRQVENELKSPTASFKSVADVVGRDMAMVAELLKVTNSAYFSIGQPVATALQAVRVLGLEIVHALVLRIGLFRQFDGNKLSTQLIGDLSGYGLNIGRIAEAIALGEGADVKLAKAAFCAAMLSPIGCLVLLDARTATYLGMLPQVNGEMPLYAAEEKQFGANHAAVGAYLLGLWGFSDMIIEAVAYSNRPSSYPGQSNPILTPVHVARALGPRMPLAAQAPPDVLPLDTAYLASQGCSDRIERWCELALQNSARG
jgi:HD-like signal output (HDOD) protein/CheY-like chemotaxis protein